MKLLFSEKALDSLEESLSYIASEVSTEMLFVIRDRIISRAEKIVKSPLSGRLEEYLEHLGLDHRRVIISHYKIIYRVIGNTVYITDIFDTRQNPLKMKG